MIKQSKTKLFYLLIVVVIAISSVMGCTPNKVEETKPDEKSQDIVQMMKEDKNIINSSVNKENDNVTIKIDMTKDISQDQVLVLASAYINVASKQFKGNNISVQILHDGKIIGGASLGK